MSNTATKPILFYSACPSSKVNGTGDARLAALEEFYGDKYEITSSLTPEFQATYKEQGFSLVAESLANAAAIAFDTFEDGVLGFGNAKVAQEAIDAGKLTIDVAVDEEGYVYTTELERDEDGDSYVEDLYDTYDHENTRVALYEVGATYGDEDLMARYEAAYQNAGR